MPSGLGPVDPGAGTRSALVASGRQPEDALMELGLTLTTVIVFAVILATVAGFVAARVLMRAAQSGSSHGGGPYDR